MRQFGPSGFRVWNLGVEAKVLYTAFCALTLLGIASSALFYADLVGGGLGGVRSYYAGEAEPAPPAAGPERERPGGPDIEVPDERPARIVVPVTYRKLLEVTHFHLFTMPVILLVVGHLFLATGLGTRAKASWIVAASASVLLHLGAPWLVRYGGGALALLHALSGGAMTVCMTVLTGAPVIAMWRRKPAAAA